MLNPTSYQGIVSKNQNEISLHMSIMAKIITATTTTTQVLMRLGTIRHFVHFLVITHIYIATLKTGNTY